MEHTIYTDALGNIYMVDGKKPRARLEWRADGHVFYLLGSFAGSRYEKAANLVVSYCSTIHVNTFGIRRVAK